GGRQISIQPGQLIGPEMPGLLKERCRIQRDNMEALDIAREWGRFESLGELASGTGIPADLVVPRYVQDPATQALRHRSVIRVELLAPSTLGDIADMEDERQLWLYLLQPGKHVASELAVFRGKGINARIADHRRAEGVGAVRGLPGHGEVLMVSLTTVCHGIHRQSLSPPDAPAGHDSPSPRPVHMRPTR